MLCLAAPRDADKAVAFVYPVRVSLPSVLCSCQHEGNLRHHLKAAGIPHEGTPADWAKSDAVRQYVLGSMRETAKIGGLSKSEMIRDVILTPEEWYV